MFDSVNPITSTKRASRYDPPMNTQLPSIADLPAHIQAKIEAFNARPARRATDVRVQGWSIVEPSLPGRTL